VIALFGGAFDPPHNGHVELLRAAKEALGLDRVVILVSAAPGHKRVATPPSVRLEMARAAFPGDEVILDEHARTVDTLRAHPEWNDPLFLIGADQLADLPSWKDPGEVARRARLAVATRPGYPRQRLEAVLAQLPDPGRVLFFDIEPLPIASSELRARLEGGASIGDVIPPEVCRIIERERLYRHPTPVH
jgi:nicotinate-nucleotide adenylyltransferase